MVSNPSTLYSGGQGIFNSTPYTQFALQQEAKRQAKDDALDKYYQDLPKSINGAGLRNQDVEGFMGKMKGIRDFYAKNRNAIKNPRLDNGKAQSEYNSRNTDASIYVSQSKAEELKKSPFVKVLANPDMRERVMDSDLQRLSLHDLPLNDPNRKSFDFSTIDFNPKELTPQEMSVYRKGLSGDFTPSEEVISAVPNANDLTITITYRKKWKPEQLKVIADKDISNVLSDRRFEYNAKQAWNKVKDNPEQFQLYNDIYKGIYGKNIENPEQLHAAMQVGGLLGESTRQEIKPDENARDLRNFNQQKEIQARGFKQAKELAGIKFAYAKALKNYSSGKDKQEDENILNTFINNTYDAGDKELQQATIGGVKYRGRFVDIPRDIAEKYKVEYKDEETPTLRPDKWLLTEDKKKIIPIFLANQAGNKSYGVKPDSKPIDIQNFKVDLGKLLITQKDRGGEVIDQFEDEAPVTQKGNKVVSSNTIKSLIGQKGYDGYTEQELIDYYKSNGYQIK